MKSLYLVWYEPGILLNEIGILIYDGYKYTFQYTNYKTSDLQLFSKNGLYYGFEDINTIYQSDFLFPTIKNRLPSKNRKDYDKIKEIFKIQDTDDDFEILLKTKGKLSTDNFLFLTKEKVEEYKKMLK